MEVKKYTFFFLSADPKQFLRNLSSGLVALLAAILCVSNVKWNVAPVLGWGFAKCDVPLESEQ